MGNRKNHDPQDDARQGACAEYGIDGLRPVIMKLEATDEESKIACEQQ